MDDTGFLYLTKEGYKKLQGELTLLTSVKRREIADDLDTARSHGDLKENAEYHAAKEAQMLNEIKIADLTHKLSRATIIQSENLPTDTVLVGATVTLKDLDSKEKEVFTLVSEAEADFAEGKISLSSPIGKGLLGHKKGEKVSIEIPAGTIRYHILKIAR